MKAKTLITTLLLLFVAGSVSVLVGRELQKPVANATTQTVEQPAEDALVVYYFHGDMRCPTCRRLEAYSHQAVQSAFPGELAQNEVQWKVINYELPENSELASRYEILAPTVVLVRMAQGEVVDWRNLERVWELVSDRDAFAEYIHAEARAMLGS